MSSVMQESSPGYRNVTRRVRAPLGLPWLIGFVLVPVLLGLAAAFLMRGSVENNMQQRVQQRLAGAGWSSVGVEVDGRDVVLHVPGSIDEKAVERRIAGLEGLRALKVER